MNKENKKLIIFDDENENYGELRFVKFLDEEKKIAIFYNPLIAPKYFENYLNRLLYHIFGLSLISILIYVYPSFFLLNYHTSNFNIFLSIIEYKYK